MQFIRICLLLALPYLIVHSAFIAEASELASVNSTLKNFVRINLRKKYELPNKPSPFCNETYRQVCENPNLLTENNRITENFLQFSKDHHDLIRGELKSLDQIISIEEKVLENLGIKQEDLENLLKKAKKNLLNEMDLKPELKRENAAPSFRDIKKRVDSIKIKTLASIKKIANKEKLQKELETFKSVCGIDGLEKNAFFDEEDNSITICPGQLIQTLHHKSNGMTNLHHTIGHEIGHSIDPENPIFSKKTGQDEYLDDFYEKQLSCFKTHYFKEFNTINEAIHRLEKYGIPNLKKEIEKLESEKGVDPIEIANGKRAQVHTETQLRHLKELYVSYKENQLNPDDKMLTHENELIADHLGNMSLAYELEQITPENRDLVIAQNLIEFCDSGKNQKWYKMKWGNSTTDGMHPNGKFRIEQTFKNPRIRELLGCEKLKPNEAPYCDPSGERR
jgi:hypothetical protein